jgi:TctA family transporter
VFWWLTGCSASQESYIATNIGKKRKEKKFIFFAPKMTSS